MINTHNTKLFLMIWLLYVDTFSKYVCTYVCVYVCPRHSCRNDLAPFKKNERNDKANKHSQVLYGMQWHTSFNPHLNGNDEIN